MAALTGKNSADQDVAAFRRRSRQFAIAAALALIAIITVSTLTLVVIILRGHVMRPETLQKLALSWSPAPFYLWAVWTLRSMFARLARTGVSFQPLVVRALGQVGWSLVLGAGVSLVLAPMIMALTQPRTVAGFAVFNVPALTIAVVGLALVATALMLRRAAGLEAEAARLKATLEDFI